MKIFIENYKNIRNVTLDVLESKRMILLGANGTGKTNTLEASYYEKCSFLDCEDEYADRFLLSLDTRAWITIIRMQISSESFSPLMMKRT